MSIIPKCFHEVRSHENLLPGMLFRISVQVWKTADEMSLNISRNIKEEGESGRAECGQRGCLAPGEKRTEGRERSGERGGKPYVGKGGKQGEGRERNAGCWGRQVEGGARRAGPAEAV